ncbi:cupin [Clostridium botulinum]|uniref:cupin domain-containing protein n=1 Tax=Clostridium botulinum TaxID=1491 RepID=UPI000654AF5D|nr:cupin domain-containing protein [Clostridium botulinum]KOC55585.1 cupin [Clostridium botulinum]KOC57492.1 cupin [Clostridium botulinum]
MNENSFKKITHTEKNKIKLNAKYFIEKLNLKKHPEGGYYKESFTSQDTIGSRQLWTSIYFLLNSGEVSHFHRLKSDELWYFHDGEALTIYMISPSGELIEKQVGLNIEQGEAPQVLVPKGYIFGSTMNNEGFSLVGCMVSPGFQFQDFELFTRKELLEKYPYYKDIIKKLTVA